MMGKVRWKENMSLSIKDGMDVMITHLFHRDWQHYTAEKVETREGWGRKWREKQVKILG